jgi:(1->4)-alpha-D-glucan 1-alpha-D-glucosylmutase
MTDFVDHLSAPARANMLVQTALRYTIPGVPDLYQGAELPDFSLVDPDNRRPVDYPLRQRLLADADAGASLAEKPALIAGLLELRRDYPELFRDGDYRPLRVTGLRADHVLAFERSAGGHTLLCAVALHCADPLAGGRSIVAPAEWWGDTALTPDRGTSSFRHLGTIFAAGPAVVRVFA